MVNLIWTGKRVGVTDIIVSVYVDQCAVGLTRC